MAERRMFNIKIIDSDAFLDLPATTQNLYFHLSMRADDDGFINNPKKIIRMIGASEDDLNLLLLKRFVLGFDSGVIVIKHWRLHNLIRSDRYKPTYYRDEKSMLELKPDGVYTDRKAEIECLDTNGIPIGYQMATQDSIGKDSIGKARLGYIGADAADDASDDKKHQLDELISVYVKGEDEKKLVYEWLRIRKAKKSAISLETVKLNLEKLDEFSAGSSRKEYLSEVIRRGWATFYPLKEAKTVRQEIGQASYDIDRAQELANGRVPRLAKKGERT